MHLVKCRHPNAAGSTTLHELHGVCCFALHSDPLRKSEELRFAVLNVVDAKLVPQTPLCTAERGPKDIRMHAREAAGMQAQEADREGKPPASATKGLKVCKQPQ